MHLRLLRCTHTTFTIHALLLTTPAAVPHHYHHHTCCLHYRGQFYLPVPRTRAAGALRSHCRLAEQFEQFTTCRRADCDTARSWLWDLRAAVTLPCLLRTGGCATRLRGPLRRCICCPNPRTSSTRVFIWLRCYPLRTFHLTSTAVLRCAVRVARSACSHGWFFCVLRGWRTNSTRLPIRRRRKRVTFHAAVHLHFYRPLLVQAVVRILPVTRYRPARALPYTIFIKRTAGLRIHSRGACRRLALFDYMPADRLTTFFAAPLLRRIAFYATRVTSPGRFWLF